MTWVKTMQGCAFLPVFARVPNFQRPLFPVWETDRLGLSGWYLGGKISEWEPWTLSGNQFLSSPPLSTACRSICISDISAFVFLRSFHLYFFKPLPSICSTQLLWHSIPFLLRSQLTNSLSLSTSSSSAKSKISVQERALLWYISFPSRYNCFSRLLCFCPPTRSSRTKYRAVSLSLVLEHSLIVGATST